MKNFQWYYLLLIGLFAKGCVYPGWASASELVFSFALIGFVEWYRSRQRPPEVTALEKKALEDIVRLEAKFEDLHGQLGTFKMKLGFRDRNVG